MDTMRFFYEVRPQRPPRIPGRRATLVRQSVMLTKEEVKKYMEYGAVYRKTTKGELIKVTGANLNTLHTDLSGVTIVNGQIQTRQVANPNLQVNTSMQPRSNPNQSYRDFKKDKHHHNNNNKFRGDERGKSATVDGKPQTQVPLVLPLSSNTAVENDTSGTAVENN